MISTVPPAAALHPVRAFRAAGPHPVFGDGAGVRFLLPAGPVQATVLRVDRKARADLPLGVPYLLMVRSAPPGCGYAPGRECTMRAGCLELDPDAEQPAPSLGMSAPVVLPAAVAPPQFLVAFMREGGTTPVQGALLVEGETLEAASAAAMAQLTAELDADVRNGIDVAEATILLLNASEVPAPAMRAGAAVIATVTW